jgi:starch synthase
VIHNLAHQGVFSAGILKDLMLPLELVSFLEYGGALNFLKAGMVMADRILTVSPTYAKEICTPDFGMGLDPILRARRRHLYGILNGADTQAWNPETDKHIPAHFSSQNPRGKAICKAELQRELGLPVRGDRPLFGFISRLDFQKGVDQIEAILPWLMSKGAQIVLLGTGDPKLESFVRSVNRYIHGVGLVQFSNALAHKITAASDFLLMPSRFEPCGLTQQHALLYGTLPIVHATGGLRDTVHSFHPEKRTGNGWAYRPLHTDAFRQSLGWALQTFYHNPKDFQTLRTNAMTEDRGWDRAAALYEKLFAGVLRYK